MSKIEELIQQYCPDGVEYMTIGDIFEIRGGYTPSKSNPEFWTDGTIPWFRMEDIRANGRLLSDSIQHVTPAAIKGKGLFKAGSIILATTATIGEHAMLIADSLANQRFTNLKIRKSLEHKLLSKFVFYYFFKIDEWCLRNVKVSSFPAVNIELLKTYEFPIPPKEVQEEIVRILETFSTLTAELQAELQARRKQYEYYRDQLLSVASHNNIHTTDNTTHKSDWRLVKLGEIATEMYRGTGIKRDEIAESGIPCIRYGEIHTTYNIWFDRCVSHTDEKSQSNKKYAEYGDILFAITSEDIEGVGNSIAYIGEKKIMVGGDIVVMKHQQNPKYLSYALSTTDAVKQKGIGKVKSKVVHTNIPALQDILIPLPPLEEQQRIADILDRFDALVNDLSSGLPAEIKKRQQQYEYYRNKLLSFKNKTE